MASILKIMIVKNADWNDLCYSKTRDKDIVELMIAKNADWHNQSNGACRTQCGVATRKHKHKLHKTKLCRYYPRCIRTDDACSFIHDMKLLDAVHATRKLPPPLKFKDVKQPKIVTTPEHDVKNRPKQNQKMVRAKDVNHDETRREGKIIADYLNNQQNGRIEIAVTYQVKGSTHDGHCSGADLKPVVPYEWTKTYLIEAVGSTRLSMLPFYMSSTLLMHKLYADTDGYSLDCTMGSGYCGAGKTYTITHTKFVRIVHDDDDVDNPT